MRRRHGGRPGYSVVCAFALEGDPRDYDADLLAAAGADLVVTTLDDVDTTALAGGRLATRKV